MDVLQYEGNIPYAIRDSTSNVDTSLFASGPVNPIHPLTTHPAQPASYVSTLSQLNLSPHNTQSPASQLCKYTFSTQLVPSQHTELSRPAM